MAREDFFDLSFDELAERIERAYVRICEEADECLACLVPDRKYGHSNACKARRIGARLSSLLSEAIEHYAVAKGVNVPCLIGTHSNACKARPILNGEK